MVATFNFGSVYIQKKDITLIESNQKLPLLYTTCRPDLIHIPIKMHENIHNGY